ncbi:hypothetical protein KKA27_00625 [Patescibacteria group bacterium]|nr:hypothetical protein [Patescibacteria group bacterium]MBU2632993.1 hypothetical protein [Patescibacteria group bacterium]
MGLFSSYKRNISRIEFSEACSVLYSTGFSETNVNDVHKVFRGDLDESLDSEKGIDAGEIERGIKWLGENKSKHSLSSGQIETLESVLRKKL